MCGYRRSDPDFEVANHYTATHPASPFVDRIMLRAFTAGAVTVMNRDVTLWQLPAKLAACRRRAAALLRERFGFDLPGLEASRPAIPEWR